LCVHELIYDTEARVQIETATSGRNSNMTSGPMSDVIGVKWSGNVTMEHVAATIASLMTRQ